MGNTVKWYKFPSREAFDVWHNKVCIELGLPKPSVDIYGNIVGEPFTTSYTDVIEVAENDFRAQSEEKYAEGLTLSERPITTLMEQ